MSDVDVATPEVSLLVNGVTARLRTPTVSAALEHHGVHFDACHVAVAVNEAVVPRTAWDTITLAAGDRIEIITAVAGG